MVPRCRSTSGQSRPIPREKELEPAVSQGPRGTVRRGPRPDQGEGGEASRMASIAVDPARLLFRANQGRSRSTALWSRRPRFVPDHPEVYLTLGDLALGEGRLSDARLNFENALALTGVGRWDAERTRAMRRGSLTGLAAVSEAREDWNGAQARLRPGSSSSPSRVRRGNDWAGLFSCSASRKTHSRPYPSCQGRPDARAGRRLDGVALQPEGRSKEGRGVV